VSLTLFGLELPGGAAIGFLLMACLLAGRLLGWELGGLMAAVVLLAWVVVDPSPGERLRATALSLAARLRVGQQCRVHGAKLVAWLDTAMRGIAEATDLELGQPVRLEWLRERDIRSVLDNPGTTIMLRIADADDPLRLLGVAAVQQARNSVLGGASARLTPGLRCALTAQIAGKIVSAANRKAYGALESLLDEAGFVAGDEARRWAEKVRQVDSGRLLWLPLVAEVRLYDALRAQDFDPDSDYESTASFVEYVQEIASKKPGENVLLSFSWGADKIAVVLVASRRTLSRSGVSPHLARATRLQREGCSRIYFVACGKVNVWLAQEVARTAAKEAIVEIASTRYGERADGLPIIVVACNVRPGAVRAPAPATAVRGVEEVGETVQRYFAMAMPDDVKEVVGVVDAWSDGDTVIVEVAALAGQADAARSCVGPGAEYASSLGELLSVRRVILLNVDEGREEKLRTIVRAVGVDAAVEVAGSGRRHSHMALDCFDDRALAWARRSRPLLERCLSARVSLVPPHPRRFDRRPGGRA
jgi:hypothetical protein